MSGTGARDDDELPRDERSTAPLPSTDAREAELVREGSVIDRKYRVERVVGEGGMGIVVAAKHLELGGKVALKFVRAARAPHELVDRMRREARIAFRLKSDHIARLLDLGTLPSGAPYIVMEYLEGRDLARVLADRGPLPIAEAVDYVLQACEAMAEAHRLGIVHRDLKPSNLFLIESAEGGEAHVKVLDFGIAKASAEHGLGAESITKSSQAFGSPLYMSPEQVRGVKDIDARSDIWSLGVILHELVAGSPPFEPGPPSALAAAIAADPPEPLRGRRTDAPQALEAVVLRCLSRRTADRYPDVHALASALAPFAPATAADRLRSITSAAARAEARAPVASSDPQSSLPGSATTQSSWHANAPVTPRRARVVVAAAIVVGAIFAAWMFAHRTATPTQGSAPASSDSVAARPSEPRTTAVEPGASIPEASGRAADAPLVEVPAPTSGALSPAQGRAPANRSGPSAPAAARGSGQLAPRASVATPATASAVAPLPTADAEQRATSRRH